MANPERTALVVGAGIGGLAAALMLRRAGWQVRVFERSADLRELGFALALAPNALSALREIGIADVVTSQGVSAVRAEVRQPSGRVLRRIDLSTFAMGSDPRAVVTLRSALHGALLAALGTDAVELRRSATGFAADPDGVSLRFAGGDAVRGDVLVGADGVSSVIRRTLHPFESTPRASGFVALRGVANSAARHLGDVDGVSYLGNGVEAGLARASATAVYWYLSLLARDVGSERDPQIVLERHSTDFDAQFKAITSASDDLRFDELLEREPLPAWGRGRVTLLGDAAHPMLPHAGQGAAQALEDAVGLGLALAPGQPLDEGLRRYERVRQRRTLAMVTLGRRIARTTTTHNRLMRGGRDLAVQLMPLRALVNSFVQKEQRDPNRELRATR